MGTKEFGKVMKRIQTLEEGRVPANQPKKSGESREKRKESARNEYKRLVNNVSDGRTNDTKRLVEFREGENYER